MATDYSRMAIVFEGSITEIYIHVVSITSHLYACIMCVSLSNPCAISRVAE